MKPARKEQEKFPVHRCMSPCGCKAFASFGFGFGKFWYCGEHKALGDAGKIKSSAQGKLL